MKISPVTFEAEELAAIGMALIIAVQSAETTRESLIGLIKNHDITDMDEILFAREAIQSADSFLRKIKQVSEKFEKCISD